MMRGGDTWIKAIHNNIARLLSYHPGQLKKQFRVQIIGILEEIYSFNWPKMHLWKGEKKLGRALPPPHLDKIQKNRYFLKPSLID